MSDTYIATVFSRGATTKAHSTMSEAFAWVKEQVGASPDKQARVMLGWTVLLEYTARETRWHQDGYVRWERERQR